MRTDAPTFPIHLDDAALIERVRALHGRSCTVLADLLAHLAELDRRRLYADAGFDSMHAFCVRKLGMSDQAAFKRVRVARTARRFPAIFDAIAQRRLHLSGLVVLCPHLTDANHSDLLTEAFGKTRRELQKLVAARAPKPDVPTSIRRLPARRPPARAGLPLVAQQAGPPRDAGTARTDHGEAREAPAPREAPVRPLPISVAAPEANHPTVEAAPLVLEPSPAAVEPLSADRYRVT